MTLDDELLKHAMEALARTPDGRTFYLFLQKTRSEYVSNPPPDALREHNGRRTFAAELMAAMAGGIRETHGGRDPTDEPIVYSRPDAAKLTERRSPRQYIRDTDTELADQKRG